MTSKSNYDPEAESATEHTHAIAENFQFEVLGQMVGLAMYERKVPEGYVIASAGALGAYITAKIMETIFDLPATEEDFQEGIDAATRSYTRQLTNFLEQSRARQAPKN